MCAIFVALDLLKKEIYEDTTKSIQTKNPTNVLSVPINAGGATLLMVTCEFIQVPRLTFMYNFYFVSYKGAFTNGGPSYRFPESRPLILHP